MTFVCDKQGIRDYEQNRCIRSVWWFLGELIHQNLIFDIIPCCRHGLQIGRLI